MYVMPKVREPRCVLKVDIGIKKDPKVNLLKVKCHEASNEISHQCLWSQFYSLLFTTAMDESQTAAAISRTLKKMTVNLLRALIKPS